MSSKTYGQVGPRDFIHVLDPLVVTGNIVCRKTKELDTPLLEFVVTLGETTKFGRTDGWWMALFEVS